MSYRRLAPLAVAGLLGFGVAAPAAAADGSSPPATIIQTANNVTVSLPGIGSLTFSVDPSTGAVSNLVATADPSGGFTAGVPMVTDEGVQVAFTAANAPSQVLQVEVEREDGVVTVKAESEADQPEQANSAGGAQGDAQGEDHGSPAAATGSTTTTTEPDGEHHDQPGVTASTTEADHEDTTTTQLSGTTPTSEDHNGSGGSDGGSQTSGSSSDGGQSGSGGGGQD